MNITRTLAVAKKESRQIIRDSRSLYLALGIPVMLMILFGFALSLDVDDIPIAVWDQNKSPESRDFIDRMTKSTYFRSIIQTDNYNEIVKNLDNNNITVGIVIPFDFSRNLKKGDSAHLQAIVDGSDSSRANLAIVYLETIASTFESDIKMESLTRQAVQSRVTPPVDPRIRIVYNPELKSRNNIIPGLIPVIMMIISALLTSLTIVRERETGTMEQLMSTPLKPIELVVGKLMPYFTLGYIDLLMVYLMGRYVFQVPFKGSLLIMFFISSVFLVCAMSIGFLVSVIASNQFFATQLALLGTVLPTFLLSGFVFPIANMPQSLQYFTYIIPARHYITILRAIYLKGVGWTAIIGPSLALFVFAFVVTALVARKLGKNAL
jgi:ABC-2 type transport system permease protein